MLWDAPQSLRLALSWQGRQLTVRQWGNWYEYEGTYWLEERKRGVDRGEQNLWVYAFHVLVGHHGVFSLTPIWWLAVVGAYGWYRHEQNVFRSLIFGYRTTFTHPGYFLYQPASLRSQLRRSFLWHALVGVDDSLVVVLPDGSTTACETLSLESRRGAPAIGGFCVFGVLRAS
ncbi:MAG: hypothetical protein KatS3mg110_0275 [Pirellulaceae bacterium]|nr:MAG: hypothetical protein KatS3mg110_0275 [Pirellulaceae bacterium]